VRGNDNFEAAVAVHIAYRQRAVVRQFPRHGEAADPFEGRAVIDFDPQ
jgi:hypothetical protein